jgi:nucleoside-diphosphate-sugar epimerase
MSLINASVVGSNGFIGQELVSRLRSMGFPVLELNRDNFDAGLNSEDLGHIYYCAGTSKNFLTDSFDTVDAHVTKLSQILNKGSFKSLTYLSSTRLYDFSDLGESQQTDSSFRINPHVPRNLFDLSKLLGESMCLMSTNPSVRVARISNVYQNIQDSNGFIGELLRWYSEFPHLPLVIPSCKEERRDYIHMDDLLTYLIHIGTRGQQRIYNVGTGINILNSELEKILREQRSFKLRFSHEDCFADSIRLDVKLIQSEFGLPKRDFFIEFSKLIDQVGGL